MLDKELLTKTVEEAISGSGLFLVSVKVTPDNIVTVTVDSKEGVDIEQCVALSHRIHEVFDPEVEDYELEVGSAGLTAPFTVRQQYEMNVGNPVEVLTRDGRKLHGTLTAVSPDFTTYTVTVPTKVKKEGAKRPVIEDVEHTIAVSDTKDIHYEIKF